MCKIIDFPTWERQHRVEQDRLVDRLAEVYDADEVRMILDEMDEIININDFNREEIIKFYQSVDVNGNQVEIMGVLNDNNQ